ncbi:MAG TPA: methyltransferase domain-containing protein [Methanocella sp.]|nr:methyltransferase domain-containing protein [Methanocella sp.]
MSNVTWDEPELAECYDRVSDLQFESGQALIDRMNIRIGDLVLDIGCGTGRLAFYLSKIIGPSGGGVIGIDPSPHRLRIAESKLKSSGINNLRFKIGRGEDLHNFPGESFHHVCYSSVFHWIDDKRAALREAFRVLKPEGKVGITTIDRNYPFAMRQIMEKLSAEKYPELGRIEDEIMRKLVSRQELEDQLRDTGYLDVMISYLTQKRYYPSPRELLDFMEASSFGNFMREVPDNVRSLIIEDLSGELEMMRTEKGIEISSETMIAVAERP